MKFPPMAVQFIGLALALPIHSFSTLEDEARHLSPINVRDWEDSIGIQRRAAEDFSHLSPKTQEQLIFGRHGDDGQLILANMTLHAPNGMDVILMERFEPLTKSVDCSGDDGSMSLTFKSAAAFKHALSAWSFVNDAAENKFLLIANHDGCGALDQRQPYLQVDEFITAIHEDAATWTTLLSSQPAPWSDVANHFEMDFGHALPQATRRLKHRDGDRTATSKFALDVGFKTQKNIFTGPLGNTKVDCLECFVSGTFQLTGHVAVQAGQLTALSLVALPQNVAATLRMRASLTAKHPLDKLSVKIPILAAAAVPGAGIGVPGIFTLGATVSYDLALSSAFKGTSDFDFGLRATLPGTASVIADAVRPADSAAHGFDAYSSQPGFGVHSLTASASVSANTVPKLAFGVDVVNVGRVEVAVSMKLPDVSATLSAEYNADGVCGSASSKTGVKLDSKVDIEVDLDIKYALGSDDDTPAYHSKLWAVSKPLFSKCFPLNIPGLGPGPRPKPKDSKSSEGGNPSLVASGSGNINGNPPSPSGALAAAPAAPSGGGISERGVGMGMGKWSRPALKRKSGHEGEEVRGGLFPFVL